MAELSSREPIIPDIEDVLSYAVGRDSLTRKYFADPRLRLMAGYPLLLQVAHPVVSQGVVDHSDFHANPWKRLARTTDFVHLMTFGTPEEQRATGKAVRKMHRRIKAPSSDIGKYHALEPDPWSWVWGSLGHAVIDGRRALVGNMKTAECQKFWTEWRLLGRFLGIRERDLPESWAEWNVHFEDMAANRLERTQTVSDVLELLKRPGTPPETPGVLKPVVNVPLSAFAQILDLTARGLLSPELRERFEVEWTNTDRAKFLVLSTAMRRLPSDRWLYPTLYRLARNGEMRKTYLQSPPPQPQLAAGRQLT